MTRALQRIGLAAAAALLAACAGRVAVATGSIAGAIRLGNQAIPAVRVCALPPDTRAARCATTPAGAARYRIDGLPPGDYRIIGWPLTGDVRLIAHADAIRCIRAPCPEDRLRDVTLAVGVQLDGIDLDVPYLETPTGWPQPPPG